MKFDIEKHPQSPQGDIPTDDWVVLRFKAHLLYFQPQAIAAAALAFTANHDTLIELQEGQVFWAGYRRKDLNEITEEIIRKTKEDPLWIDEYAKEFWERTQKFKEYAEETYFEFSGDLAQIRERTIKLLNQGLDPQVYGYITICANVPGEDYWIHEHLKKLDPSLTNQQIFALLAPSKPSFLARFHKACGTRSDEDVIKEFFYVKASYWQQPELGKQDLVHEEIAIAQKPAMKGEVADFIHIIEEFIAMQDERKANALRLCMCLKKIAMLAAESIGYSLDKMENMSVHEFLRVLEGEKIDNSERKNCLWVFTKKGYGISGEHKKAKAALQKGGSLKGRVACQGCVSGTAKIVLSEDDFFKVEDGDILVASMTRPEYLPVMKKAAAFVTAEGGVTCHAAVVARELGKPCLISVRGALGLKDGEKVEVDAVNGVVRKI